MKLCPKCKVLKPLSEFQKHKNTKDGVQYHCRTCRKLMDSRPEKRAKDRERYHQKKDSYLNRYYKRTYTISLGQYNELLALQNSCCDICKQPCSTGKRLAVDHCHTTNKVRGLLCSRCNQALGVLKDDINILKEAIKYLEKAYS